jgi:site-specific DNA recombinase
MPSMNGHGSGGATERVALYLRVSSEEQRDRETIEIQREFLEQYRNLYELEVADIYKDDGISGTIPLHERAEGRRLLDDAKAGRFDAVLVYKLDRLGRSLLVIVDAHDRLQTAGVSLRSATEPIDTSNPSGRLIFQMLASFAEYERETIGERTRAGLHRALRNGKFPGRLPYGYKLSSEADESSLVVVEEEARIVREIIANIASGSTLYSESKRLNDEGVPSPGWRFKGERHHGRAWSPSTVGRIVHQSAYSGVHKVRHGNEGFIERPVPPIVEPGLHKRALAELEANLHRASPARVRKHRYLLSGLVRCGVCGYACGGCTSSVVVADGSVKPYRYYRCGSTRAELGARSVPAHRAPSVSAPWLEDLVWTDVKRFIRNPGEVLERVREQLRGEGDDTAELGARCEDLAKRLAAKHSEKERYIRLYAQGHISEEELETYLADLKNQISNLRLLIEAADADLSARQESAELADTTYAWLTALRERVEEIEEDTPDAFKKRQQLVRLLVEKIVATRDEDGNTTIEITYRFGPGLPEKPAAEGDEFVSDIQNSSWNAYLNPEGSQVPSGRPALTVS